MSGFPWEAFAQNLALAAGAAFAVMLATFAVAVRGGLHRIVDVAWGIGFTAVALVTFLASAGEGDEARRVLVTVLTSVWGLRLAAHIARRGRGHGEDPRYEALLAKAPGSRDLYALRMVYLLQGALVWLVSLPVQAAQYIPGPLTGFAWAGTALWALGLFFEAVGDAQLARFKADPAHRGRVMDRGLWSWTRHPNYFGDFCVWWGLFLLACDSPQAAAVALVSPLVMSYLLINGSGKPMLERHMARRPGFAEYAARTSGFFPLPPRPRR
jgi:steroid 5-alpha reductase family enzyme